MTLTILMWVVPLSARITGLLVVAAVAVVGWLKRKAIATFTGAVWKAVDKGFWNFIHRKLQSVEKPSSSTTQVQPANQRTYRGRFNGYFQYENPPREWFFEIENDGTFTKVPVLKTNLNLFSGVTPGTPVEVDTQVGVYHGVEIVQRVRILEKLK